MVFMKNFNNKDNRMEGREKSFGGLLMLKKSLYKMGKAAILCESSAENPYYLKVVYYNNEFIDNFKLDKDNVLGKNYDFLFDKIETQYSENHLQAINLLKAIKNCKPTQVRIDIPNYQNKKGFATYQISFSPNGFRDQNSYYILTFEKLEQAPQLSAVEIQNRSEEAKALIQNLERKLRNERALRVISETIVSDIPLKNIADKISSILCNHLKVGRCILYNYSDKGETGFISESHDPSTKTMIPSADDENADFEPIRNYINLQNQLFKNSNLVKNSNTTLICNDVRNDNRFESIADICREFNIASQVSIITTFNGVVNGGLLIHQSEISNWYLGEIEFLEMVAEQFSIAVDRSYSLDKVMEVNQKLLEKTLQLKKALKEEKRVRKMQGEFVAMVSHEFKTPLQIIDGTREVISIKLRALNVDNEFIRNSLSKIKAGVDRLSGLVQGNLALSKVENNKHGLSLKITAFSLKELIHDILDKNSTLSTEKHIEITCDLNNVPDLYNGDRKLLDHCFTNIIINAIKYSGQNSKIRITGSVNEKEVIIKVSDSGIGIPQSDIANIGQKFFRAKNTLAVPGTGIGLYLTKYFIGLHNGSVSIESEIDKGTSFFVILPINNLNKE